MSPVMLNYDPLSEASASALREGTIEYGFDGKLQGPKYTHRSDISNRATLDQNFREKFNALNRVKLTDKEFARPLKEIVSNDVFTASKILRRIKSFTRDGGTPLNSSFVKLKDRCKNHIEVVKHLCFHMYSFKPKGDWGGKATMPDESIAGHRFNAIFAGASINEAIEYYRQSKTIRAEKQATNPDFNPLNIACVFSPSAEGNKGVQQIQGDLSQEKADNEEDPKSKKDTCKPPLTA